MKIEKPVALIYFGICGLIFVGLLLSAPGKGQGSDSDTSDAEAALAAFSGGNLNTTTDRRGSDSFFEDPDFMESATGDGSIDEEAADPVANNEDEPDIIEKVDPDNPINPQTGQKYTNDAMKKFAALRKRFPNNDLIPRKKTPEEKKAEEERRNRMFGLQSLVVQGNATEQEVNDYYDMQLKSYKDRKELLDYVFKSMGDKMSDDIKDQYSKILKMNERQIQQIEDQRKRALSRAQTP